MKPFSLRRRLLQVVLPAVAIGWGVSAVLTYRDAHRGIDAVLDAHLEQSAGLMIAQAGHELEEIDTDELDEIGPYSQRLAFQVWEHGSALVLKSADAPRTRLSAVERGFSEALVDGTRWRIYSNWDKPQRFLIQIAEDHAARERIARHVAVNTLWPMLAGLPALAAIIWWLISRVLRPVSGLAGQISERDAASLAPLAVDGLPLEVVPLIARLNELFARITASLESERRFTANAAHELRNPLAALRAQAEVARGATQDVARNAALDKVIEGCERMTRLVSQLLLLARVEHEETTLSMIPGGLAAIARRVIADAAPEALNRGVEIGLDAEDLPDFMGDPTLLTALLRNLVDNAVRHAQNRVDVRVARHDSYVELQVMDDGPGIDPGDRARLGSRFYRGATASGTGSGLGLSIVTHIAGLHGATVEFGAGLEGRGLGVQIRFHSAGAGAGRHNP